MMTLDQINLICGNKRYQATRAAFLETLIEPLRRPVMISQVVPQTAHESGRFRYTREVWGPTAAQKGYEGRSDLGNIYPGDGKRFMGHSLIMVTGRTNHRLLTLWCRSVGLDVPDFEAEPQKLALPQYATHGVNWFFSTRGKILDYCLEGNIEMVTHIVNGGLNGFDDRLDLYHRTCLVMLGYGPRDVRVFQRDHSLVQDGIPGPNTRAAMHKAIEGLH